MLEIKPLDDVMDYFNWAFMAYVVLLLIICLNLFKACYIGKRDLISKKERIAQFIDLFIDILCGIAMYWGLMFLGVLADNNAMNWFKWSQRMSVISGISFIVFIINCMVVFRPRS